jgi:hypothetical protein
MTMEAIESGEGLMLNALCNAEIANRFGKYSEVLALLTTSMSDQYGLSATIECAVGVIVIAPPVVEAPKSGDDSDDNAASYFNTDTKVETIDLDDDSEAEEESASEETVEPDKAQDTEDSTVKESSEAPALKEGDEGWTAEGDDEEWDDDWD